MTWPAASVSGDVHVTFVVDVEVLSGFAAVGESLQAAAARARPKPMPRRRKREGIENSLMYMSRRPGAALV
jgi:hypothetical protein